MSLSTIILVAAAAALIVGGVAFLASGRVIPDEQPMAPPVRDARAESRRRLRLLTIGIGGLAGIATVVLTALLPTPSTSSANTPATTETPAPAPSTTESAPPQPSVDGSEQGLGEGGGFGDDDGYGRGGDGYGQGGNGYDQGSGQQDLQPPSQSPFDGGGGQGFGSGGS